MAIKIRPEQDIEIRDGHTWARSPEPWFELLMERPLGPGRWVRMRYRVGFFDAPVRPMLRFRTASGGSVLEPLNGAVCGIGEWVGRIPDGTVAMSISPTDCEGPFAFEVLSVEGTSMARLVRQGLSGDARNALLALGIWVFADKPAAERLLKVVTATTPFEEYGAWRSRRSRPLDLAGFDRPRADWSQTPKIRLVASLAGASQEALARTLDSLRMQAYPRWTLTLVDDGSAKPEVCGLLRTETVREPRVSALGPGASAPPLDSGEWWSAIMIGDTLPPEALAVVTEVAARSPGLQLLYGDDDAVAADGRLHDPHFKPDWDPHLQAGLAYAGPTTFVTGRRLASLGVSVSNLAQDPHGSIRRLLSRAGAGEVGHIARVLYRRFSEPGAASRAVSPLGAALRQAEPLPSVAVVIPVRDRPELLEGCARGLLERTDYPSIEVVIVDNGSVQPETFALFDRLGADARVTILKRPGPFNYSALCNEGVAATGAPLLLFLNSDIEVIGPGWLRALAAWAARPDVGAVGAKLLYPDDTIQHAGVIVGLNGFAGHLYGGAPRDEPGHLGELRAAHEMSAVTGACMAVERRKYEAVGGLDAENLPVDLNDVDLCLRLAERGWRTIWMPEAELYHLESASRGRPIKGSKVYSKERAYFTRRWARIIRNDPFYHPALSLFGRRPALA